ncbi:MAG: hypothetical protein HY270_03305 [Deltaproteobacteria bacterium]|nr:hypothetical protein [Deltaproteobacteria bacterium]
MVTSVLALGLALFVAGCGDDGEGSVHFAPAEIGRVMLRPGNEAQPGDLSNRFLSSEQEFEVRRYEVPGLLCVRTDSTDYLHIPEVTHTPGDPGLFYAIPPVDAAQPVLIVFHGNGLDFIEAEASLFVHAVPRTAEALLAGDPGMAGFLEILNRGGAVRGLDGELGSPYVAEALERGWGVVVPGNCWGDGGHHRGELIDYYIPGRRYGRIMDDDVWTWFREQFPHDRKREYSFGCSGGGQRTAQLLLSDPNAVVASGIDSPADYLPGFKDDPPGLFLLLSGIPGYRGVLNNFYIAHYGSLAGAAEQSLGTQLLPRQIETPIYLAYSNRDTFATNGVTSRLVDALTQRQPAERSLVWNSGEAKHCQINNRERAKTALDWIAQWSRD